MGWCVDCGIKTKGRAHQCKSYKKKEKIEECRKDYKYKAPQAPLTAKEKENIEKLKLIYNPGYALEKYFQEVMNSII